VERNEEYYMSLLFLLSLIGVLAMVPVHYVSVEHERLEKRFGNERGRHIGSALGMISGWGIFLFYFGLWIAPQPRFDLFTLDSSILIPLIILPPLEVPLLHLVIGLCCVVFGAYLGIKGVTDMGLQTAETHRPERIIRAGLYNRIRHPQYLGAMFSHLGITFLLSSWFSFLVTPLVIIVNYVLCWKEEVELVREFGDEYEEFVPRLAE
jgi:hypothetical protein